MLDLSIHGIKFLAKITSARDQADKGDYRPCGLRTHQRYQIHQIGQGSMNAGLIEHPNLCFTKWSSTWKV